MQRLRGIRFLLLVGLLSGCTAPGDNTPQGPGTSYTSYLSDITAAILSYEERCGLLDPSREAQRKVLLSASFPQYLITARDISAMNGRTSYDSSCVVNGLKAAACSAATVGAVRNSCADKETQGRLDDGRRCGLPEECKGYCKGIPQGTACGSGTCAPKAKSGPCPEGPSACDTSVSACVDQACVSRAPAGSACKVDAACLAGLQCLIPDPTNPQGTCGMAKLGKQGDPCALSPQAGMGCGTGLSCYQNSMMDHVCQPTIKLGQACPSIEACDGTAVCLKKQPTDMTGVCQPLGKPGDVCSTDPNIGSGCELTLRCFAPMGATEANCLPLSENGQACYTGLPCLSGRCDMSGASPTCLPLIGTGLGCSDDSQCQSGKCDVGGSGLCQSLSCPPI